VADALALDIQSMLSELWIGSAYEVFRMLGAPNRKLARRDDPAFAGLARDLKLVRITVEKYEIANDGRLREPLVMQRRLSPNESGGPDRPFDTYTYDKKDPQKAHIMPMQLSRRGSISWYVTDGASLEAHWVERRDLSERMSSLWAPETTSAAN
jgi:hypothetical protein